MTYAVIVLQHRPLKDEEPGFPTTKILATFSKVSFFVPNLHDRLFLLPNNIRGKKGDNLIVVLYRQPDQGLQIVFKDGLNILERECWYDDSINSDWY